MKILTPLLSLALAGCFNLGYVRSTQPKEVAMADAKTCQTTANTAPVSFPIGFSEEKRQRQAVFAKCMRDKGHEVLQ